MNQLASAMNHSCLCIVLRPGEIGASFHDAAGSLLSEDVEISHPNLFAHTPVYITDADLTAMLSLVAAMEHIAASRNWLDAAEISFAGSPAKVHGVFMGYDFHMTPEGPKLIEINTNAGGAFLNLFASKQFRACCDMLDMSKFIEPEDADRKIADMFEAEWEAAGRDGKPGLIAIVDETPKEQFLYPEFVLAAKLLQTHGMPAVIASPEDLNLENGMLTLNGVVVDMIYNRLTDFDLSAHPEIRQVWQSGKVVLTPDPLTHRRMADKRNLVRLSDPAVLAQLDATKDQIDTFAAIVPKAVMIDANNAEALWGDRKRWFFKPVSGYGGKAVYRGDKLTRKTWDWILSQEYIAQELAHPSQRAVKAGGKVAMQKFDVRLYTYRGNLLAAAARLYEGQTTNFRTPGGGFAPLTTQ